MSLLLQEFNLDRTGVSPANRIIGEEHRLGPSRGPFHSVALYGGPFYNDRTSWRVYKNGVELEYGKDYFGIVMVADETVSFGGEVDECFLVRGCVEGDLITVDAQLLGGVYQNYMKGIADLWQAFVSDDRPILWQNVIGKQGSWNPSYHLHALKDVVGWDAVIIALERMTNAQVLRNIPAFEKLIDWVLLRIPDIASTTEIYTLDPVDKLITLNRLLYAAKYMNFNAITFRPERDLTLKTEMLKMNVSSTNFPRVHPLFWEIQHETTTPEMFERNSGKFDIDSNEGSFFIIPRTSYMGKDEVTFRVVLRQGGPDEAILSESKRITLQYNHVWRWDYGELLHGSASLLSSAMTVLALPSPEAKFLVAGDDYWKYLESTQ